MDQYVAHSKQLIENTNVNASKNIVLIKNLRANKLKP